MNLVRRSLLYSIAENYLGVILQLASTVIVSRLLTPVEVGTFAVAAVFSAMASTFRDFGVAEYLIQVRDLGERQIRAAFAVNLIISWAMALMLYAGSEPIAEFYRQPGVAEVLHILSLNFVLIPFGAVTIAYFRRELNYRPVFLGSVLASLTGFAVAVGGAMAGMGYLSLAWSSLAGVLVTVLVASLMRPKGFPILPSLRGVREVIEFGKHASSIYLVGQIGRSAPEAVIGRVLDMASVAFFSRAGALLEVFNRAVLRAVAPVCLPYFSQANRAGHEMAVGYVRATSMLTVIGWPLVCVMGVHASIVVEVVYGEQWAAAVLLAQLLCVGALIELPYQLAGDVMIASGRVDQTNRLQIVTQGLRILGLLVGAPWGLWGICWGLVVASIVGALIAHRFLRRTIDLRLSRLISECMSSLLLAGCCAAFSAAVDWLVAASGASHLIRVGVVGLVVSVTWLAGVVLLRHPIQVEIRGVVHAMNRWLRTWRAN